MIDAGKYKNKIFIIKREIVEDEDGFQHNKDKIVLTTWAAIKTLKGYTIIMNGDADFEKAYVNFTIRYPKRAKIDRKMFILYRDKLYRIDYINNIDEADVELELQACEVSE